MLTLLVPLTRLWLRGAGDWPGISEFDTVGEIGLIAGLFPLVHLVTVHALRWLARAQARSVRRTFGEPVAENP